MKFSSLIGFALALGFSTTSFSEEAVTPEFDQRLINDISFSGYGCPRGSVWAQESQDNRSVTVDYDRMNLVADYRTPRASSVCNLNMDLNIPSGWQVSFATVNQRGYAYAADNNSAGTVDIKTLTDRARYEVQITRRRQPGPYRGDYSFTDNMNSRDIQWTDCNQYSNNVTISTYFNAEARGYNSLFEFKGSSQRNTMTQFWTLNWRRCGAPPPPPPTNDWVGQCVSVLETVWGQNISEHWGRGYARSHQAAVSIARDDANRQCWDARAGNNMYKCTTVESKCYASRG